MGLFRKKLKYNIREMLEQDIPTITKQETLVFGDTLGEDLILSDFKLNPYSHYFVIEINKEVSGYVGIWIAHENAQVINFYIIPEYQDMGFGTTLFDFVIELCEMSSVINLTLEVRVSNLKAQKFYEKYGFVPISKRNQYYNNGEDALVLLKEFKDVKR
jgi:[ribosomal protein S18]-alanine N-acetyltransferase